MNEQTMIDLVNRVADNDKVAPFQNGFVVLTNEEMVKFAELIVKECIEQASTGNMHGNNQWDKALTFAADNIKKHFGVKE